MVKFFFVHVSITVTFVKTISKWFFFFFFLQKLLQPFTYILQVPGKQIRAKLALAFNYWLKVPADKLFVVGDIVQMLHNASLL